MTPVTELTSMTDLRREIDALDTDIVALLAHRSRLIGRAAELKPAEGLPARIDARVEEVVGNVRASATLKGMDPALAEKLWRIVIEWSITHEEELMGEQGRHGGKTH